MRVSLLEKLATEVYKHVIVNGKTVMPSILGTGAQVALMKVNRPRTLIKEVTNYEYS